MLFVTGMVEDFYHHSKSRVWSVCVLVPEAMVVRLLPPVRYVTLRCESMLLRTQSKGVKAVSHN
jgi:hypothetical protein